MNQVSAGQSEFEMRQAVFDIDGLDERHKADKIMADFATAFSLDMDLPCQDEKDEETKWPLSWALAFAVSVSLMMWGALATLFYFI
jgi:hypothetical protein